MGPEERSVGDRESLPFDEGACSPRLDSRYVFLTFQQGSTISHGIQARTISGQASSEFSHIYFENTKRGLNAALEMVRSMKEKEAPRSTL
jgi:hypothetical protein